MTPTVSEIQNATCEQFGIPLIAMLSSKQGREWSQPRQIAMALSAEMTSLTLTSVGRLFGDRDHSTCVHAVRTVKQRCDADPLLAARVGAIRDAAVSRATVRLAEQRDRASQRTEAVEKRETGLANEPKRNEYTESLDRKAKAEGCRMLLERQLVTGMHWLKTPEEVRQALAA